MKSLEVEVRNLRSLEQCEAVIEAGRQTFIEVGKALREIRDYRLYKKNYSSFEEYTRTRWGWTRRKVDYDIEAADFVEKQIENGHSQNLTKNQALRAAREERSIQEKVEELETQLRELGLPEYTPPREEEAPKRDHNKELYDILNNTGAEVAFTFVNLVTRDELRLAYLAAVKRLHPDRGGDPETMAQLNATWAQLEKLIYG